MALLVACILMQGTEIKFSFSYLIWFHPRSGGVRRDWSRHPGTSERGSIGTRPHRLLRSLSETPYWSYSSLLFYSLLSRTCGNDGWKVVNLGNKTGTFLRYSDCERRKELPHRAIAVGFVRVFEVTRKSISSRYAMELEIYSILPLLRGWVFSVCQIKEFPRNCHHDFFSVRQGW